MLLLIEVIEVIIDCYKTGGKLRTGACFSYHFCNAALSELRRLQLCKSTLLARVSF